MPEYNHIYHTFDPVYDENSKQLILGGFPSVKSREQGFYYGHPQNRFWRVMAAVLEWRIPETMEEKKRMLLENHIAVWDVIDNCDIRGSSDSSIRNVVPADISGLLKQTRICRIYANGKTAGRLYQRFILPSTETEIIVLPSTSPANAACSLEELIRIWGNALKI